jgi:hypothetical protein
MDGSTRVTELSPNGRIRYLTGLRRYGPTMGAERGGLPIESAAPLPKMH